jgi:hypothetical protein
MKQREPRERAAPAVLRCGFRGGNRDAYEVEIVDHH